MTTPELCELAGLSRPELQRWIDAGLLQADRDGRCREFAADELERARRIKALHAIGLPLSRLARENLAFNGQAFVSLTAANCAAAGRRAGIQGVEMAYTDAYLGGIRGRVSDASRLEPSESGQKKQ